MDTTFTTRTLLLLGLVLLSACSRPTPPDQIAANFWDRAQALDEPALALLVPEQQLGQLPDALERLQPAGATITLGEVELLSDRQALVPTRLLRGEEFSQYRVTMVTHLVAGDDGWQVDLDGTMDSYRSAVAAAVGNELRQAAERVKDAIGAGGRELGAALEASMRNAAGDLQAGTDALTERAADELGAALESMGADLARELNSLAGTLEQELAELESSGDMDDLDEETLAELHALAEDLEQRPDDGPPPTP